MVRRTKEAAQETRERIIDAAEAVFHAKGVAHASLAEIAGAAGVTRGAIYWHFTDKADLFEAMMDRVTLPLEDMLAAAGEGPAADPLALLKLCTTDVLLRTARDKHLQRVFDIAYHKCEYVGDAAGVRDRHIASQQGCLRQIEKGFKACVSAGALPAELNAKEAALGALSLVSGLIANWVLDPKSFSLERHAANLVDTYFRGLANCAAPARKAARRTPTRKKP
jgi:TetR/AcrR family acrAB operon transcriptional repressor